MAPFKTWNIHTLFKLGAAQIIVKEIEKYKLKLWLYKKLDGMIGNNIYSRNNYIV